MSKQNEEIRQELRNIVTRNGKSGRIPEILEQELDALVEFYDHHISKAVREELEIVRNLKGETVDEWAFYAHPYLLDRIAELKAKQELSQ